MCNTTRNNNELHHKWPPLTQLMQSRIQENTGHN